MSPSPTKIAPVEEQEVDHPAEKKQTKKTVHISPSKNSAEFFRGSNS